MDPRVESACISGGLEQVKQLVQEGVDPTLSNKDGDTVFHLVCSSSVCGLQVLEYLTGVVYGSVEASRVNTLRNRYGSTPLHFVCSYGHTELVKYLAQCPEFDPVVQSNLEDTPLALACRAGHESVVRLFRDEGWLMKYNPEDVYKCIVLSFNQQHTGIVELLLGVLKFEQFFSRVVENDHVELARFVTERKNCLLQDTQRLSGFHCACERGHDDIVKYLVSKVGCDVNSRIKGDTALHLACTRGRFEIVKYLTSLEQCDCEVKDSWNRTLLHTASSNGHLEVVQHIVSVVGCNVNAQDKYGNTALHLAIQKYLHDKRAKSIITCLVKSGGDFSVKNKNGVDGNQLLPEKEKLKFVDAIVYHKALSHSGSVRVKSVKCLLTGPPGAGKSTTKRRLLNEALPSFSASTGVADAPLPVAIIDSDPQPVAVRSVSQQGAVVPDVREQSVSWRKQTIDEELLSLVYQPSVPQVPPVVDEEMEDEDMETETRSANSALVLQDTAVGNPAVLWEEQEEGDLYSPLQEATPLTQPLKYKSTSITDNATSSLPTSHFRPSSSSSSFSFSSSQPSSVPVTDSTDNNISTLDYGVSLSNQSTDSAEHMSNSLNELSQMLHKIPKTKQKDYHRSHGSNPMSDALLHIVDTGGQPEFHEILPALVTGPAINLLVFKLTEDLQSRYSIEYRLSSGNSEPYETSLTHEEVIFRSLSSIACLRHSTIGWEFDEAPVEDNSEPAAFLIGTHRDQVSEERVTAVNEHLKMRVESSRELFEDLVQYSSEEQVVFALDNLHDTEEIKHLRGALNNVIETRFQPITVPLSWYVFSQKIRRRNLPLLKVDTCFKIARESGILSEEEFKSALWFLHHRVGVLMHFPHVAGLEDVVIVHLQVVFDSITHLITECFTFKRLRSKAAAEDFRLLGRFNDDDLKQLSTGHREFLTPKRFVSLLDCLHIVAVERRKKGRKTEVSYFMPCVLKPADIEKEEEEYRGEEGCSPLLVCFECGYVPVGVFCCLVVHLLSSSSQSAAGELKWELANPPHYSNKITFRVGCCYDSITLICRATYLEVVVNKRDSSLSSSLPLHQLASSVRSDLHVGIETVTKSLHYTNKSRHQFGFHCSCQSSQPHPTPAHPAVCEYNQPVAMKCVFTKAVSKLEQNHLVWYGKSPGALLSHPSPVIAAQSSQGTVLAHPPCSSSHVGQQAHGYAPHGPVHTQTPHESTPSLPPSIPELQSQASPQQLPCWSMSSDSSSLAPMSHQQLSGWSVPSYPSHPAQQDPGRHFWYLFPAPPPPLPPYYQGTHHLGAQWSGQLSPSQTHPPFYQHQRAGSGVGVSPPLPVQPGVLGIHHLDEVLGELQHVVNWKDLGLKLGLLYPTLEKIEEERRGKHNDCKRDMLAAWLNKTDNVEKKGGPSWEQLVGALNHIGERPLAADVEERYLRKRSHDEDTDQSSSKRRY